MNTLREPINDSINFFKSNIRWICLITLPIVLPLETLSTIMAYYFNDESTFTAADWPPVLLDFLFYPIYQGAVIFYIASAVSNEYLPLRQYYQLAIKFWSPLFFLYLLTSTAVLVGMILLIVPGLIIMSRLAFSEFYCLLHQQNSSQALLSSWNNTKKQQWLLLKGLVVVYSLILLPYLALSHIISAIDAWNPLISIIIGCSLSVLFSLITIFYFRVYTLSSESLNEQP